MRKTWLWRIREVNIYRLKCFCLKQVFSSTQKTNRTVQKRRDIRVHLITLKLAGRFGNCVYNPEISLVAHFLQS
jgi:hypothetical protein